MSARRGSRKVKAVNTLQELVDLVRGTVPGVRFIVGLNIQGGDYGAGPTDREYGSISLFEDRISNKITRSVRVPDGGVPALAALVEAGAWEVSETWELRQKLDEFKETKRGSS